MNFEELNGEHTDHSQPIQMSERISQNQETPAPMLAPPSFSPPLPAWQSGPEGIRRCMNRNTYIWLTNGNSFWFVPTFVGMQSIIGFRWRGFGWVYHKINARNIRSYQCF